MSVNTTKIYAQQVTVYAGQVTWVKFVVNPPVIVPTEAATEMPPAPAEGVTATPELTPVETPAVTPAVDATPSPEVPTPEPATPEVPTQAP